jgi:signal transduction histidine kinase
MQQLSPSRIRGLIEAAASVVSHVSLSDLLRSTVETAMELTGARYGALGVLGDHGTLSDFIHAGIDPDVAEAIGDLPRGRGVLGVITSAAKTVRLDDISSHPDSYGFPDHHPEMTTFLGVPVRVGSDVFGNLYLTEKPNGFSEEDEITVELLAVIAGTAVATLRLQDRLRRAALTEDRERIARDLHDSIIQDLFAVGLGLQASRDRVASDPDLVTDRIDDAVERLDETIGSLRSYIFDLRAQVLAPSLRSDIATLAAELARPHGVPVEVTVRCPPNRTAGPNDGNVYAVTKEGLSNALRHSRATRIEVTITCRESGITVEVSDDGVGFEPGTATGGMGLANMAERVSVAGGELVVESAPGSGTTLTASFPA